MSSLTYIVIGMIIGAVLAWYVFNWLKKISEKKLLSRLEKGITEHGVNFLKFKKDERRMTDERKTVDRESIIRELIGREQKAERTDRGDDKDTFYKRTSRDDIQRSEVQGVDYYDPDEHKSGVRQDKTGNKPIRKWIDI